MNQIDGIVLDRTMLMCKTGKVRGRLCYRIIKGLQYASEEHVSLSQIRNMRVIQMHVARLFFFFKKKLL